MTYLCTLACSRCCSGPSRGPTEYNTMIQLVSAEAVAEERAVTINKPIALSDGDSEEEMPPSSAPFPYLSYASL
ncbi:unnamed protein product [Ilex paraguariensis]|uniref:Uncharacterized protein n=1 Tax=Ilex paraguariensis TaxID=185542 RepID=A0ABC8RE61_9AQUA